MTVVTADDAMERLSRLPVPLCVLRLQPMSFTRSVIARQIARAAEEGTLVVDARGVSWRGHDGVGRMIEVAVPES